MKRFPNSPQVILDLAANSERPNVEVSHTEMTEILAANFLSTFPHRQRSLRTIKPKILTSPDTHQQKGDEILKPQCGRKRKRKRKNDKTIELEVVRPYFGRERLRRRISGGNEIPHLLGKLDTSTFQCYFENLWRSLPDEKRNSFAYLDCLWFNLYLKPYWQANVLKWIKKKQIFSKKYVIVPIVRWDHWSLLIFCHMGDSLQTKTSTPCMLLLDSLRKTNPKRLEPEIRKFVLDLYKTEKRPETKRQVYRIPLAIPKVPQQRNGVDCGNFVLYYINLFVKGAPECFSISEGYPYFMKKDWFTQDSLADFYERLRERDNVMAAPKFQENLFIENVKRRRIKRNNVHVADHYPSSELSSEILEYHQDKLVKENNSSSSKKEKKSSEDLNIHISTEDDSRGIDLTNQINFDEGNVPPPVCSCTGFLRKCYKSGGGWQSSCCTITLSVYPLPQLPNKRNSRIVGRKMNGNVFGRLLTRLGEEGYDLSVPVDLKDYWAKHGSNRNNTVK